MEKSASDGLVVHAPLYFKTPKEVKINNKLKETWRKIEAQNEKPMDELHAKEAAKLSIANAAAAGIISKEMTKPCEYDVHHETVVDHNTPLFHPPAVVAHDTTVYKNQPILLKNDAIVASDYYPEVAVSGPRAVAVESTPIASTSSVAVPRTLSPYHLSTSEPAAEKATSIQAAPSLAS